MSVIEVGGYQIYQIDDFIALDIPEIPSLLGNNLIVPQGKVIIYGSPGAGKSFAAHQLCTALAGSSEWLGYPIQKNIKTLYLQAENVPKMFQERATKMRDSTYGKVPNFYASYISDFYFSSELAWQKAVDMINAVGAEFVLFDPLFNVMSGSELDDKAVDTFIKYLNRIIAATGAGVGLVHHSRKASFNKDGGINNGGADDIRGHSAIHGWADTIVRLRKQATKEVSGSIRMEWQKVRYKSEPTEDWLIFDDKSGILRLSKDDPVTIIQQILSDGPKLLQDVNLELMRRTGLGKRASIDLRMRMERTKFPVFERYDDPVNRTRNMNRIKEDKDEF